MTRFFAALLFVAGLMLVPAGLRADAIPQQIEALLGGATVAGNDWSIVVENENGSLVYYEKDPDRMQAPASVTKTFTSAAAFELLGPDYVFETHINLGGDLDGSGVLQGHLHLIGEHDITWNTSTFGSGGTGSRRALDRIAQDLKAKGLNGVAGGVNVWGATFYNRGQFDNIRTTARATLNQATAEAFRDALVAAGISVAGAPVGRSGFNAPGTHFHTHRSDLLTWSGRPLRLENALIPLHRVSHNASYDGLLFHLGWKLGSADSLSAGSQVVRDFLRDVVEVDDASSIVMQDGSGLSWNNRFSSRQNVQLNRWMLERYPTFETIFPVSGQSGTISSRLTTPSNLIGRVRAKTGTLSISIALSGFIDNPFNDERLFFSFITNRSSINQSGSRTVIDNCVRTLGVRGIPFSPEVRFAAADGGSLAFAWSGYPAARDGYTVEASSDGAAFAEVAQLPVPEPVEYIIETRGDLAAVQNHGDFSYEGDFTPSTSHSTAPGCTPGAGSMFLWPEDGPGQARFTPSGLASGRYDVFVTSFNFASANAENVTVRLSGAGGVEEFLFDLTQEVAGNRWAPVGTMEITSGAGHFVEFDSTTQTTLGEDDRMNPAAVRFVSAEDVGLRHEEDVPAGGEARYFRVAALGPHGPSKFSRVYGTRQGTDGTVLVVDGNNRWSRQPVPENSPLGSHDFAVRIGESIPARFGFDTVHNESVEDGSVGLGEYPAAVWSLGEESTADVTFTPQEQVLVEDYLGGGGALFATGSEIGWDLDNLGSAADRQFFRQVLKQQYVADSAETFSASGIDGQLYEGLDNLDFSGPPMIINWPDVVLAVNGGVGVIEYVGGTGGIGGVTYDGAYRLASFGFPFESLNTAAQRSEVMFRTLSFFLPPGAVSGLRVEGEGPGASIAWDEPEHFGVEEYRVYLSEAPGGPWQEVATVEEAAFDPETAGYYAVRAVDRWGDEGPLGEPVFFSTATVALDALLLY